MAKFESKYSCGHTVMTEVMPQKFLDQMNEITVKYAGKKPDGFESPFTSTDVYIKSQQTWAAKNVCKACRPPEDDSCKCD